MFLSLPSIFGDGMVLQRDTELPVWGKAEPSVKVTVAFNGRLYEANADNVGDWRLTMGKFSASADSKTFVVSSGNESIELIDVLVGELWLCAGQSNMQFGLKGSRGGAEALETATEYNIRLFWTPLDTKPEPAFTTDGKWEKASAETAQGFSAAGYFFARGLTEKLGVPVGIISAALGGTTCENFVPYEVLKSRPELQDMVELREECVKDLEGVKRRHQNELEEWEKRNLEPVPEISNLAEFWSSPEFDDADWSEANLPLPWDDYNQPWVNGVVWLRRTVNVPHDWDGDDLELDLGLICDRDHSFFNGVELGRTEKLNGDWMVRRTYKIDSEHVKPGRNVIASRLTNYFGGGPVGLGIWMRLINTISTEEISLCGTWKYQNEVVFSNLENREPIPQLLPLNHQGGMLFNGAIHPHIPFAIRGVLWYQGESNVRRREQHKVLFQCLVEGWRKAWNSQIPFFVAQLAPFTSSELWVEFQESQVELSKIISGCRAVVINDAGDPMDIHPIKKDIVGERFLAAALADVYNFDIESHGPECTGIGTYNNKIVLNFSYGENLEIRGEGVCFELAGPDEVRYPAEAIIENNTVTLSCDEVENPLMVYHCWRAVPEAILFNGAGFPASCFRKEIL